MVFAINLSDPAPLVFFKPQRNMRAAVYWRKERDGCFAKIVNIQIPKMTRTKKECVKVKIHSVGLNPCDVKFLYGDKIPSFFLCILKWILHGRICGFDFSGIVVEVPTGCHYAIGDEVIWSLFSYYSEVLFKTTVC